MSDFAQTVKQQADIVKVIEGYIRLRKAGAQNYSGLCPFHKEKTPSFSVHAVRQFYHCFGCGASGDVFSFVSKIENVTFPEAVRIVAQKCGIPLPKREFASPEQAAEARLRTKLLELHETAAAWFEEQLRRPEGALAREYLAGRGLDPKGIKEFRIGYAPDSYNALRDRLSGMADQETLRASGLFASKEQGDGNQGPLYDRFRKRVVFPICNEGGRVIAFTARTLGAATEGEKAGPKYINSPETPLYSKGQVLFNLDKAKTAIRTVGFALLVEGQMDCISVFLRGIQNVIATSGTAFTEHQAVRVLRRHTSNVIVNFDPDSAGADAAEKSIALLTEEGFAIKLVTLEGGLDPDRFIRERGVEAYKEAIRGARRQSDYLIERARLLFPGASAEQKVKAMNFLLPHIQKIPQELVRVQFARDASKQLLIDFPTLQGEIDRAARRRLDKVGIQISRDVAAFRPYGSEQFSREVLEKELQQAEVMRSGGFALRSGRITEVERILVRALANEDPEFAGARSIAANAIAGNPAWFEHLTSFPALRLLGGRGTRDSMDAVEDSGQRALVAEALLNETRPPYEAEVQGALDEMHRKWLDKQYFLVETKIQEAHLRGDFAEEIQLAQQRLVLNRERNQRSNRSGDSE
jgi:DNA primase